MSQKKTNQKKPQANRKKKPSPDTFNWTGFIMSLTAIALLIVGLFQFGAIGHFIFQIARILFGEYPYVFMVLAITALLIVVFKPKGFKLSIKQWCALGLSVVVILLIQALMESSELVGMTYIKDYYARVGDIFNNPEHYAASGMIGSVVYGLSSYLLGKEGTIIFIILFIVIIVALLYTPEKVVDTVSETTGEAINQSKSLLAQMKAKKEARKQERMKAKEAKAQEAHVKALVEDNYSEEENELEMKPKAASQKSLFISLDENDGLKPIENSAPVTNESTVVTVVDDQNGKTEVQTQMDVSLPTTYENYKLPSIHLLDSTSGSSRSSLNGKAATEKSQRLIEVLKQFGIDAEILNIHIGPAVTKFELKPDSNVKISKISSIQDNLMMELAVKTLRIEAPIPGKSAVGIEIPNQELVAVGMKDIILNAPDFKSDKDINVALGKDLTGKPITVALNKMPHLLIAGATGSGKSVSMNAIITSILLNKTPDELKLLLIDPKKVEFAPFVKIPHLIGPVISDPMLAAAALNVVVSMMDDRYGVFSQSGVRNIAGYNEKVKAFPEEGYKPMPWIVVIIDELADLMAVAGKDVEGSIQRITQLARAAGIHLIVATQRPSVDVVTGVIKANIPSRIAFAVSSAVDSRTILDTAGAEKLLGYGDMLYVPMGEPHPLRVQGVYVSDDEVHKVAQRASEQAAPHYEDDFIQGVGDKGAGIVASDQDDVYEAAKSYIIEQQRASTSLLQRQFKIGYNRAANLMDALEQNGVVGPQQGSRPRLILIKKEETNQSVEDTDQIQEDA